MECVVKELKEIKKPFIVLLNCVSPEAPAAANLASGLQQRYGVPVLPVNCMEMQENEIRIILSKILFEFPVKEIKVEMPRWVSSLEKSHWLRSAVYGAIQQSAAKITKIREVGAIIDDV